MKGKLRIRHLVTVGMLAITPTDVPAQPGDLLSPLPPDYAQVRTGLPLDGFGTPGGMYCGPVAAADLLKWLNGDGFPLVGNWPPIDLLITLAILDIGTKVQTDPEDGTSSADMADGLETILDSAYPDRFFVGYQGRGGPDTYATINARGFAAIARALEFGDLAIPLLGWYHLSPFAPSGMGNRCGGHFVAMTGYDAFGGTTWSRFADPARDVDCATSGSPCIARWETVLETHSLQDWGQAENATFLPVTASRWVYARSGNDCSNYETRTAIQDGFVWIGASWLLTLPDVALSGLQVLDMARDYLDPYQAALDEAMSSACFDSRLVWIYHCGPSMNEIYRTSVSTNTVEIFPTAIALNQPSRLAYGSQGRLYVLHRGAPPAADGAVGRAGLELVAFRPDGSVAATTQVPGSGDFAYHDRTDRVYWWDGLGQQLHTFTSSLTPVGPPVALPPDNAFATPAYAAVDPNGDVIHFNHDGSNEIFRFDVSQKTSLPPISDPALIDPAGMVVNDRGQLFVVQGMTSPILQFDTRGSRVQESVVGSHTGRRILAIRRPLSLPIQPSTLPSDLNNDAPDVQPTGVSPSRTAPPALRMTVGPSPFRSSTSIRLDLASESYVTIRIVDAGGRRVRGLCDGPLGPGSHTIEWDGFDGNRRRVAAGVYFAVASADGMRRFSKIVRVE